MTLSIDSSVTAGGTGGTVAATLTTSNANDIIVMCFGQIAANTVTVTGIADTAGLTWHKRSSQAGPSLVESEVWWAYSSAALTSDIVTVSYTGTGGARISLIAVSGVAAAFYSAPWDTNVSLPASATSASASSQSVTISSNLGGLILGFLRLNGAVSGATLPSGWSAITNANSTEVEICYDVVASAQSSVTETISWVGGASENVWIVDVITAATSMALAAGGASTSSIGNGIATVVVANATGGTSPYTYQWYRSTTSGFTPGAGNIVSGATSQTLNDTGLTDGTTYYYVNVVTDHVSATANSNQTSATPKAVTAGTASTISAGSTVATVTVANATGGTGPYTYQWYRSTTSGFTPGSGNIVSGATSQTLNDTGLTNGTTYYYVNIVTDSLSATSNSNQTSATPSALYVDASKNGSTISGHTLAVSGFSTTTTNCVLIASINSLEGNSVTGVADTDSLTWTKYVASSFGFSYPQEFWYAIAASAVTNITITATFTNAVSGPSNITVFAVAGADTTNPFDPNTSFPNHNTDSGTSIAPSSPLSTTNPNTLVFGQLSLFDGSPGTITEPTGFTSIYDNISTLSTDVGYKVFSSAQSGITPTYTWVGSSVYNGVIWGAVQSNILYAGLATQTARSSGSVTVVVTNASEGTSPYTYQWYRSTSSGFTPGAGNIVSGATSQTLVDTGLTNGTTYYYINVVTDNASATANSNQVSAVPAPPPSTYVGGFIGCF